MTIVHAHDEYVCRRCGEPSQRCQLWCRALRTREIEQHGNVYRARDAILRSPLSETRARAAHAAGLVIRELGKGFGAMSQEERKAMASRGGKASQEQGRAHRWSPEEAQQRGKKAAAARAKV